MINFVKQTVSYQNLMTSQATNSLLGKVLIINSINRLVSKQGGGMSKFCANLSFMFTEKPFLERFSAAKNAGFKAVETGFPFGFSQDQVVQAKNNSGLQQILINTFTGDVTKGEMGFAAIPGKEKEFQESIAKTLAYAKALQAKKIHIMSGLVPEPTTQNDQCYENNLRYAVDLFEKEQIIGVIEPINPYSVPNYYMNCYKKALNVVKSINSPNLRIMLDLFHMQHIRGNLTNTIRDLIEYTGHVQIAQNPNRNEPDSQGEINYKYVLQVLAQAGYTDWIGLEYKPAADPVQGLQWIKDFGYQL